MDIRYSIHAPYGQRSLLDKVPNELLILIKESFYKYDLVGHVNFYRLSPRTADLYPAPDDLFWERLCFMNGLGNLPFEDLEHSEWFCVALDSAAHAVSCTRPGCGRARIERNAKRMAKFFKDYSEDAIPAVITAVEDDDMDVPANTVFEHIAFRKTVERSVVEVTAHLRLADGKQLDAVEDHPLVQRSFATFPPIDHMSLNDITTQDGPEIEAYSGVTVEHVLQVLCEVFCEELSVRDVLRLLESVDPFEVFPQSWTTQERFSALKHLVDWFDIVDWRGFSYMECYDDSRFYVWMFEPDPEALEK